MSLLNLLIQASTVFLTRTSSLWPLPVRETILSVYTCPVLASTPEVNTTMSYLLAASASSWQCSTSPVRALSRASTFSSRTFFCFRT